MKRTILFGTALAIASMLALLIGCDTDRPGPIDTGGQIASIELRATHTVIRGFSGDVRTEQLTAVARDQQGVAVVGEKIYFSILNPQPWKGTLSSSSDAMTDELGQVTANYQVSIDRSDAVLVEARSGNVTSRISLDVVVVNDIIGRLTVEATPQVIAVPPNSTRQSEITATLTDANGAALSGMMIRFRTEPPSVGFVDADTATTNNSGRASRSFTNVVNKYGLCEVIAQVGDTVAKATVEIRQVGANAWVTLSTPTPLVSVLRGQDAVINLRAVVVDSSRVGVSGTTVAFEALPIGNGPTFGSLTARDTTDADGSAEVVFHSNGAFGRQRIRVTVLPSGWYGAPSRSDKGTPKPDGADEDAITAEVIIEVRELLGQIGSFDVRANPEILSLPADSNGMSRIDALVRDIDNNALEGVQVKFTASFGTLSEITATNSAGIATAIYRNDYQSGDAWVTASIPGAGYEKSVRITIRQTQGRSGSLLLSSDRSFIYADNGLTYATLTALLSDDDGQVLSNKQITFTKTHGTVNSPVTTDSLGIAHAVFRDIGLPSMDQYGNVVPAIVTAHYSPLGLQTSLEIVILPRNPVARITLQSAAEQIIAGSPNPVIVRATCFLVNNDFAPEGTLVRFDTDKGRFGADAVPVVGNYGIAETQYFAGSIVGNATLKAFVQNEDGQVLSNDVQIALIPGAPKRVTLSADPNRLVTNDPNVYSTVSALVTDSSGNPVSAGTMVRFAATLGNITPSSITGSNGRAEARLISGVSAGLSEVTGTVLSDGEELIGRTTVTFVAGGPNSIELSAEPLNIAVAGTGGISTSTLTALVRDANGNLVEQPTTVVFQLLNEPAEPAGCNINNRGQLDSALTAHGRAAVSLNAGIQIGGKVLRAYTWRDAARQDIVEVTNSSIMVVSGPPVSLDIDVNDEGKDALGGAWKIEVSARVFDIYRNPVANNIPVVFTVEPNIASITPGYTGNRGSAGTSEPGLAYANLIYQSAVTFSQITISASVATPHGRITGEKEHVLPLQSGVLELNLDPGNWRFDRSRPNDIATIRVWAVLKDGHYALINNAPILFRSNRGALYWLNHQSNQYTAFFPAPVRKYTGVRNQFHNEEPGQATVYLRGVMNDFYLDDMTLVEDAQLLASVEGYNDVVSDPVFIFFTRR